MDTKKVLSLVLVVTLLEFAVSYLVLNSEHYTPDSYAYEKVLLKLAGEGEEWPHTHWTANFLYPFLALPAYVLTRKADLSFSLVSLVFYLLLGIISWFCCKAMKIKDENSLAISLLVLTHPIIIGYSALHLPDVPAIALSMLCVYGLFTIENSVINGIFFGLTLLTRPQFFALFPMYFAKFNIKQVAAIFLVSLAMTAAWGFASNAPHHPLEQFLTHSDYVSEVEMASEELQEHLTLGASLMDLFLGIVLVFYYQVFLLVPGFMQDKGKRRTALLLLLLSGIAALLIWPRKVPRYFLIVIAPFTIWAVFGLAQLAKKLDKRLFWIAVTVLVILNNAATFLFFNKGLHPLPS